MSFDNISENLKAKLDELKTVRDELKLKAHLGGMEAKEYLEKVEPELHRLENELRSGGQAITDGIHDLAQEARGLLDKLRKKIS